MARPGSWSKEDYRARCPLHVAFRDDAIICRSAMPDSTGTVHQYREKEALDQIRIFCCGCFERCEHYRAWKHFMWEDEDE